MVSGARVAITRTPGDCQCADTTSTAVTSADKTRPICCRCGPSVPGSTANIGEPWDTNIAGAVFMSTLVQRAQAHRFGYESGNGLGDGDVATAEQGHGHRGGNQEQRVFPATV